MAEIRYARVRCWRAYTRKDAGRRCSRGAARRSDVAAAPPGSHKLSAHRPVTLDRGTASQAREDGCDVFSVATASLTGPRS